MNRPRCSTILLAVMLCACPGSNPTGASAPLITGDACAFHLTAEACRADSARGCKWNDATLSCGGGDGGTVAPACSCPAGGTCVVHVGGPVSLPTDTVTCVSLRPGCTPSAPCTCLAGERDCAASPTVSGLCICDDLRQ